MNLVNPRDDGSHDDTISLSGFDQDFNIVVKLTPLLMETGHCCYICYGMQWRKVGRDWQRILHPVAATWHQGPGGVCRCFVLVCSVTGDIVTTHTVTLRPGGGVINCQTHPLIISSSLDPIWIQTPEQVTKRWLTNFLQQSLFPTNIYMGLWL